MFARATANQTAKRFTLLSLHEVTSAFLRVFIAQNSSVRSYAPRNIKQSIENV
jgi:hypothetical protein